eukprot:COSAG02_NODE_6857_length_3324_cov_17.657674_1_plen_64_part_00
MAAPVARRARARAGDTGGVRPRAIGNSYAPSIHACIRHSERLVHVLLMHTSYRYQYLVKMTIN